MENETKSKAYPLDEQSMRDYLQGEVPRFFGDIVENMEFVGHFSLPLEDEIMVEVDAYRVKLSNYGEVFATHVGIDDPTDPRVRKQPTALVSEYKFPDPETAAKAHACITLKTFLGPGNHTRDLDKFADQIGLQDEFRYCRPKAKLQ